MQYLGRVEMSAQNDPLGPRRVEPAREQVVGPHAREEIEEDLGKAQVGPLLGDDEIAG